jgi:16S rRNA (guanine1207-N2)-methyltransferase
MAHYFSEHPEGAENKKEVRAVLRGNKLRFITASSTFSKKSVDKGTALLIESAIIRRGAKVLDMGCGYGAVGIAIAKAFSAKVIMSDVNERALMLAKMNLALNCCTGEVVKSFIYDSLEEHAGSFDAILINPPQKAGNDICKKMISESAAFLKNGGFLEIVARPKIGAPGLVEEMKKTFGNCEKISEHGEFAVYASVKKGRQK